MPDVDQASAWLPRVTGLGHVTHIPIIIIIIIITTFFIHLGVGTRAWLAGHARPSGPKKTARTHPGRDEVEYFPNVLSQSYFLYLLWVKVCVITGVSVTYHYHHYHFILAINIKIVTAEVSHPDIEPRVRK